MSTPGILLRSRQEALEYLEEDLRMDEEQPGDLDASVIAQWSAPALQKSSLEMVHKVLENL